MAICSALPLFFKREGAAGRFLQPWVCMVEFFFISNWNGSQAAGFSSPFRFLRRKPGSVFSVSNLPLMTSYFSLVPCTASASKRHNPYELKNQNPLVYRYRRFSTMDLIKGSSIRRCGGFFGDYLRPVFDALLARRQKIERLSRTMHSVSASKRRNPCEINSIISFIDIGASPEWI